MLIVLSGKTMASATGVSKEITMANNQNVPVFGIYVGGANANSNLPVGLPRGRTISWTWDTIANAIDKMMTEGKNTDDMVVWDRNDKSLKVVTRVFSKASPLSEPLSTGIGHSIERGYPLDEETNEISANVQGTEAVLYNTFCRGHIEPF